MVEKLKPLSRKVLKDSEQDLFSPVKLKQRSEEILQERYVEEITGDCVVLSDGVSKLHALIIRRPIDSLIVEEVRKILV